MRKIILAILIAASFGASAQTIEYDNAGQYAYVAISPVKVHFDDSISATRLTVTSVFDNLSTACTVQWTLRDSLGNTIMDGTSNIIGADYTNWNGSNTYPYEFVIGQLKLTEE